MIDLGKLATIVTKHRSVLWRSSLLGPLKNVPEATAIKLP